MYSEDTKFILLQQSIIKAAKIIASSIIIAGSVISAAIAICGSGDEEFVIVSVIFGVLGLVNFFASIRDKPNVLTTRS